MKLNQSQMEAVQHKGGPLLVLAGPGSGKTMVITHRAKYLIEECKVSPEQILVISFTRASAREMKERFLKLMGETSTKVNFGTFHSIFFAVLKAAYHYSAENIVREEVRFQTIVELMRKCGLDYEDEGEQAGNLLGEISLVKNGDIALANYYAKSCAEEQFRDIFKGYQEFMRKNRLIDFDDMLIYTYELFRERKDILAGWQGRFRYILIDEFQDINKVQFDVIQMLAEPENQIFAVGDDDQSIYRFRGAKPEIMLGFQTCYPHGKKLLLDINYRSQPAIVTAAGRLINHNVNRYRKEIKTIHTKSEPVGFKLYSDKKEEGKGIIGQIQELLENGTEENQIAILMRTNTQAGYLAEKLMEYNLPFYMKERIPNLYQHFIAKDILAYFRVAQGGRERSDFLRIMNRPNRYFSRQSLERQWVDFNGWMEYYEKMEQPWMVQRVEELYGNLQNLNRLGPFAGINYIRKGIGYDKFLKEYAEFRNINAEELVEILDEVWQSAKEFLTIQDWFAHIEEFGRALKEQSRGDTEKNGIMITTLHGSKGLEYDAVFIPEMNEGMIPYKKAVLTSDLEEERRMFYVGMTRARCKLFLSAVKTYNGHEVEISRFITEADK